MSALPPIREPPDADTDGTAGLLAAYHAKRADLVRFFAARMNSAADAEDLIQDLYVKLSTSPPVEGVDNPSAFLHRTAVNLMLDRARSARRAASRDDAWRQSRRRVVGGEDAADEPSPEQATESRERLRRLAAAVDTLPPQTRRAFVLHKIEGLSQAQVAQRLGVSRKTVEKQISSALQKLLSKLRQMER